MADIFIIHAGEDRDVAKKLYELLSERWDTGWDYLLTGDHRKKVPIEIENAKCIVPLYSAISLKKDTVIGEIKIAIRLSKEIIPFRLDDAQPPYDFPEFIDVKMQGWTGDVSHSGILELKTKLATILTHKTPKRPPFVFDSVVPVPTFFPSVSSHETQLGPFDAVSALRLFGAPAILISAYDLSNNKEQQSKKTEEFIEELDLYKRNGGFVIVDSGNYEAYRLGDTDWSAENLQKALSRIPYDCVFCFDKMDPSQDPLIAIKEIVEGVERDRSYTSSSVLPIVHAPKIGQGLRDLKNIPKIIREISEQLNPPLIAIPERELGHGVINRAKTIQAIRDELNQLTFYQPVHVLGTGNPWTIPIFVAAGADTFDGLEWCRMVVDRDKHRLHHFQHFDFFSYQASVAESAITREAFNNPEVSFAGKAAFHNLDYFTEFMNKLRTSVQQHNLEAFVTGKTGESAVEQLKREIPKLFK